MSQPHNPDAQIFESQIVIEDTTMVGATSGSIVNKGGLSTMDTYITGHASINNVDITPNLNDIIFEKQSILDQAQSSFTDIADFYFDNSATNSFKAIVNVTVSAGISKFAGWELNGLYKPSGWVITSSFTGDLTGVQFSILDNNGLGQIQYTNSNSTGSSTIIRYRASTTAPAGFTPISSSVGVIYNTVGNYIADKLIYASTPNNLASSDLSYVSNVFSIGGTSRIVAENANSFTNFSNGGGITSMGDASIAKNLIVGENIGIGMTSPAYAVDVKGDVNITGHYYKNGNLDEASMWNANGTDISYTMGNVNIKALNVSENISSGSARIDNLVVTSDAEISGNVTFGSSVVINGPALQIPTGDLASRPIAPVGGYVRYNTETQQFEGYGPGNAWGSLGGVVDIAQTTKIMASASPSTTDGNLYFFEYKK